MAKKALRTKDIPEHQSGLLRVKELKELRNSLKDKTFDQLTTAEKDKLLELIAKSMHLIKE